MKKITLALFLISKICFSQNIVISDIIFKNKLLQSDTSNTIAKDLNGNNIKIDLNGDNEIQLSEATIVSKINLDFAFESNNISTLNGIENFSNLKELSTYEVHISAFDFNLNSLEKLQLYFSLIQDLDLSNCPLITDLTFFSKNNSLKTINLKNGSDISSIDISNSPNLSSVCVDSSELSFVSSELSSEYPNVSVNDNCNETLTIQELSQTINFTSKQTEDKIFVESDTGIKQISLININGIKITSNNTKYINIDNYTNGIYIIEIIFDNNFTTRKKIVLE